MIVLFELVALHAQGKIVTAEITDEDVGHLVTVHVTDGCEERVSLGRTEKVVIELEVIDIPTHDDECLSRVGVDEFLGSGAECRTGTKAGDRIELGLILVGYVALRHGDITL